MPSASPAQLHRFASDERARRKAAFAAAGQAQSDRARQDDIIWSNIEQMAGYEAGDPACLKRQPSSWARPERITMARNAWATACKAETSLDASIAANGEKIAALWHLYRWLKPAGWSPYINEPANG
ncbi:hypothetical protein FIV32_02210 [Sphingomonadales bacterium 58]|uniref:hypothetical protein n=1 Tax=Sphingobium sp. S8 TaxID=2758385 RepID=UPI00191AE2A3|nr:hypothetical protein [Sphingobium sp. S8]MBY2957563.1 hypothetical protein [Sphingomonadales bacterium 58]CAD7335329.1 hypothetical protein SPHS8_00453 [Sphingobium sp. S8]